MMDGFFDLILRNMKKYFIWFLQIFLLLPNMLFLNLHLSPERLSFSAQQLMKTFFLDSKACC